MLSAPNRAWCSSLKFLKNKSSFLGRVKFNYWWLEKLCGSAQNPALGAFAELFLAWGRKWRLRHLPLLLLTTLERGRSGGFASYRPHLKNHFVASWLANCCSGLLRNHSRRHSCLEKGVSGRSVVSFICTLVWTRSSVCPKDFLQGGICCTHNA